MKFVPIKTLEGLTTVTPIIIFASFEITQTAHSKIKARGIGELSLYKQEDRIIVKARNIWYIEEVMEISLQEQNLGEEGSTTGDKEKEWTEKLEEFIKEALILFFVTVLAELATRALIGS